jgi:hypothetical protein
MAYSGRLAGGRLAGGRPGYNGQFAIFRGDDGLYEVYTYDPDPDNCEFMMVAEALDLYNIRFHAEGFLVASIAASWGCSEIADTVFQCPMLLRRLGLGRTFTQRRALHPMAFEDGRYVCCETGRDVDSHEFMRLTQDVCYYNADPRIHLRPKRKWESRSKQLIRSVEVL